MSTPGARAEAAIIVRDLKKSYGEVEALRGIDVRVERGEVFALLGQSVFLPQVMPWGWKNVLIVLAWGLFGPLRRCAGSARSRPGS